MPNTKLPGPAHRPPGRRGARGAEAVRRPAPAGGLAAARDPRGGPLVLAGRAPGGGAPVHLLPEACGAAKTLRTDRSSRCGEPSGPHHSTSTGKVSGFGVEAAGFRLRRAPPLRSLGLLGLGAVLPLAAGPASAAPSEPALTALWCELFHLLQGLAAGGGPGAALAYLCAMWPLEMVPFLPTQPLLFVGGLLFGAREGTLLAVTAATLSASSCFLVSRGPLADRFLEVVAGGKGEAGPEGGPGAFSLLLGKFRGELDGASLGQQLAGVFLLRCSPVVPFVFSNYALGLTGIRPRAFLLGSFFGLFPWTAFYVGFGAGARGLLENGDDVAETFTAIAQEVGRYSNELEALGAATAVALVAVGLGLTVGKGGENSPPPAGPPPV